MAAYRFFDNAKATFGGILAAHRDATAERMRVCPVVLLAQDTTADDEKVCLTAIKQLSGITMIDR